MDKDLIVGAAKETKGKEAVGDTKLEAEGTAGKVEGEMQKSVGGLKYAIKGH